MKINLDIPIEPTETAYALPGLRGSRQIPAARLDHVSQLLGVLRERKAAGGGTAAPISRRI